MDKPEMIFFDYGHTLCYEPVQDYPAGWAEVMRHAVRNPQGVTAASLAELMTDIYSRVWGSMRPHELETDGFKLDAEIYESLGLAFDVSLEELEYLRWRATEPIYPMEGVEAFLELCGQLGIRTAVISNLSYSGASLRRRIAETLPSNRFEFILASSDGAFRKPSEWIFRRALSRAGIDAGKCWFIGDDVRCDIEGAARAGIWPVWYRSPLRCTYKPAAKAPPECLHTVVTSWDELGVMLRGLIKMRKCVTISV